MSTIEIIKQRFATMPSANVTKEELRIIDSELEAIVSRVSAASNFDDATSELRRLGELQEVMAMLWFMYDIEISPNQKVLVRKLDRPDDPDACRHTFEEIRNGCFWSN